MMLPLQFRIRFLTMLLLMDLLVTNVLFAPFDMFETHWFQRGFITFKAPIVWIAMIYCMFSETLRDHALKPWPLPWDCKYPHALLCYEVVTHAVSIMVTSWPELRNLTRDIVQYLCFVLTTYRTCTCVTCLNWALTIIDYNLCDHIDLLLMCNLYNTLLHTCLCISQWSNPSIKAVVMVTGTEEWKNWKWRMMTSRTFDGISVITTSHAETHFAVMHPDDSICCYSWIL